jgi:hypothetical protein
MSGTTKSAVLTNLYRRACDTPSDINEHLPTLRTLAGLCDSIVELGVRGGESTKALLQGLDERHKMGPRGFRILHSFDINDCRNDAISAAVADAVQIEWVFTQGDSLQIEIPKCELLFIDTLHTRDQLFGELTRHAPNVSRWIVLHDTDTFGQHGEGGGLGLIHAVMDFSHRLAGHCWRIINMVDFNNGLTVLERIANE